MAAEKKTAEKKASEAKNKERPAGKKEAEAGLKGKLSKPKKDSDSDAGKAAKAAKASAKDAAGPKKNALAEEHAQKGKAAEADGRRAEKVRAEEAVKTGAAKPEERQAQAAHARKPRKELPKREAWVDYKPSDVEKLVADLANAGNSPAEIGMILADQYAVPSVKAITGKRVSAILAEHKLLPDMPRDLLDLIKKAVALLKHMEANKKDTSAKRGYDLTVSKIRKLAAYYMGARKLPKGWRYTPEQAKLLVK